MQLKSTFLFLYFVLLFSASAWAQNLFKGRVLDAQTKQPLPGANITLKEGSLTVTDSIGNFMFKDERESVEIAVSSVGYQTKIQTLRMDEFLEIYLELGDFELDEIVVRAYEENTSLSKVPTAVLTLQNRELNRFDNTSLLPALNTLPGVRMEERSPGSFRLSIRGSTLRSPFGVRNVKMYWNDLPLTDAGGNTYLNSLDFNNIQNLEVIKGPAASLYGAGTGGVILLGNPRQISKENSWQISSILGDYGLRGINGSLELNSLTNQTRLMYAHQQADGYREQSKMRRDVFNLQNILKASEHRTLAFNLFYSDLYYQTPGGLTLAQLNANPRQARPATPTLGSAVSQKAAIYLKTLYAGISQTYKFNAQWQNRTALYFTQNQVDNSAIRNYEKRIEPGFGGRSTTTYTFGKAKVNFGAEFQYGFNNTRVFGNRQGQLDTLQTDEEIKTWQYLVFGQLDWDLARDFYLTIGASYNRLKYNYQLINQLPLTTNVRRFDPVLSPRVALLKQFLPNLSVYTSISAGFSPPTIAELRPSAGGFNNDLNPEKGWNYELGTRGSLWRKKVNWDIVFYQFDLQETIVIRRAPDGAEFFTNAGNTRQRGLEAMINVQLIQKNQGWLQSLSLFMNYTYQDFRFRNYQQNNDDFSGNWLTGAPPHILVTGLDISTRWGVYWHSTYHFTDRIPLNDANTFFAAGYRLLSSRLGYKILINNKLNLDFWLGINNALNENYSLGNDLNAVGNRFFNPAAPRNFFGGLQIKWIFGRNN
jgi:iron complex outermembrane receptor protein